MRGLSIILTTADPARLRSALTLLAAQAALGGRARLFLHEDAAALAVGIAQAPDDAHRRAHGLPSLDQLWTDASALGVEVAVCQTGLGLAGIEAGALRDGVMVAGPVSVLADMDDDRLAIL